MKLKKIEDVTRRKKTEDDFRKNKEWFRSLLKSSRDAILMMDPEGRVSYWNPAAEGMLGYTSAEAESRNLHELISPKRYLEAHRSAYTEFLRTGRGAAVGKILELQATRKDGSEITVALSLSAEWINGGWNAIGILRDITEQKEAESQREAALEALRKSEEQFRAIFEMASIGVAQADIVTGRWLRVNQKLCEITGYSADEMLALRVPEITHPEDREPDWEAFQNVVSGKLPNYRLEKRYIRKDGSIVWVNVNMTVIRDSASRPIRTIATIEDITGRKQVEAEMERSRDFIENIEDACFEIDLSGKLIFCNESFLKITGYTYDEYRALSRFDLHPTREEARYVYKIYEDIYRTGIPVKSVEYKSPRKDGTITIAEVSISLVRDKFGNPVGFRGVGRDVTDRKRAEAQREAALEALREALKRLDEIIEYLPDATFVIDARGKVIAWNRAIEQMTGIKAADMLGKGNYEYALPFYGERRPILIDLVLNPHEGIEAKYVSTQRRDAVLEGEAYMPSFKGGEAYLFGRASALQDSKGNFIGAIEAIRDITARRQAEEKYRAIFENAVEGIFQTTPEGRILSANPAMVNLYGYDSPEDLMQSVSNIVQIYANPDDRLSFRKEIEEKGTVNEYEVLCVRKDGQKVWIAVNAKAIKDKEGHIIHYDGFFEDITGRKKMENDLRKSEERLRSIVDTSNAGIIMMTFNGQILFANQQMAKMLGYSVEELVGTNYNDYVYSEDRTNVADNISLLKNYNVDQLHVQRRYICRDKIERWGYASIGHIDVGYGDHNVVLVISDITELKQMEREKRLLEDHLRQAQKMEAIGTLAGGIAHDFNNILASMMGFTEMAVKETRQETRRNYLDQVLQACERAKNLVSQILAFSRMREQEHHPVDLRLVLKEALGLLRATLPATIEIKQDITKEETHVLADPTQIHQIIMNLCTNAAYAMREKGGLLDIRLSTIEILHPTLSPYPDLPMGSHVQLSVRDNGCGMDDAIKEKIFDPFFTTKKGKEGTGLGLSVVYGIVKSSGGSINVQSAVGEGTTFTIFLPRIRSEDGDEETSQEDADLQGHERILFVDDEEMLVKMARLFFQPLGYRITATTSSGEALRLFQENPGAFDLVITDMTMPQTTGIELSRALLKIRPDLPIILCTGYRDSVNTADARRMNIRELVLKPVSLNDLGRLVRRVLKS